MTTEQLEKKKAIEARASQLMEEYGLFAGTPLSVTISFNGGPPQRITRMIAWHFRWDNAKARHGQCSHRRHRISLSLPVSLLNSMEEAEDTILHEIAHALVGPNHGHDEVWKAKAKEIGCTGQRCASSASVAVPRKWVARCPACSEEYRQHRRVRRRTWCTLCYKAAGKQRLPHFELTGWAQAAA